MSLCYLNKAGGPLWFTRLRHRYVAAGAPKFQSFSTTIIGHWKDIAAKLTQERIVAALQIGERRRASTFLSEFSSGIYASSTNGFLYVLQYCAKAPDPLFALETWKFVEERETSNRGQCYFLTVKALCKGGYLKEALDMMKIAGENPGTYPLLAAYNCLLGSSIHMKSNYANECLDLMEKQMVGKNHVTYAELLKLANLQHNLSAVHEIWKECIKNYSFNIISLRRFIWSFTLLNDLEAAYAALQHMVDLALRENVKLGISPKGTLKHMRLDIPMPCNPVSNLSSCSMNNEVPVMSQLEGNKGLEGKTLKGDGSTITRKPLSLLVMKILRWSFNGVMKACAKAGNYTLAEQLMSQMQTLGVRPSSITYSDFIKAALFGKGLGSCMEMVNVMKKRNMKPSDSTLAAISISCSRNLELDLAEGFLNQMSTRPSSRVFDTFLEACNALGRPERAVRMLAKMSELQIRPNIRTYTSMFSLFDNVSVPFEEGNRLSRKETAKIIKEIEMAMSRNGIQHCSFSMKNLLKAAGSAGMIGSMLQYLQFAYNLFRHESNMTQLCNSVLQKLVEARKKELAIEVFMHMQKSGIPGNEFTYTILIECCSLKKCFRSTWALVARMIREGYNITLIQYTALIQNRLAIQDFDEALTLLYQARSEGIQPDVYLYNSILEAAHLKRRLDIIEFIAESMHQDKVQPDSSTCKLVFTTYIRRGLFNTAMEALQVLSLRMISEDEHILEEKRAEFEPLVLAEEETPESEIMNYFKDDQDSITYALLNLRACAILGCSISWLPDRSPWAQQLSSNYKYWSEQ